MKQHPLSLISNLSLHYPLIFVGYSIIVRYKYEGGITMRSKIIVSALSALLIMGGAAFASASKNDTRLDDSNHQDDKKISASVNSQSKSETTVNGQKVEIETEHGKTYVKVDSDKSNYPQTANKNIISSEQAAKIAIKTVNGTVREIEQEIEHGKMQYKVELTTSSGEAKVRIDAESGKVVRVDKDDQKSVSEDNNKSDVGLHHNRHSGDDDNKTDDGSHQNRHSGDDDNKTDDGSHQNRHSGDDDN